MADFYIGRNRTLPVLQSRLEGADGVPIDMRAAGSAIKFRMWAMFDGTVVINTVTADILQADPTTLAAGAPNVEYDWIAADTATPGVYYGRWIYSNTATPAGEVFPVPGPIVIQIV